MSDIEILRLSENPSSGITVYYKDPKTGEETPFQVPEKPTTARQKAIGAAADKFVKAGGKIKTNDEVLSEIKDREDIQERLRQERLSKQSEKRQQKIKDLASKLEKAKETADFEDIAKLILGEQ